MRTYTYNYFYFLFLFFGPGMIAAQSPENNTVLFDFDWRFHRGEVQIAHEKSYDDSKWRKVNLPHDWSIEDQPGTDSPFSPDAISQVSGGFTTGGTGWYRVVP
jgi:beta-galactosidase